MGSAKRTDADIEKKFWKHLKSDMTVMLGLTGDDDHSQPMTAMFDEADGEKKDEHRGPIYFFTAKDVDLVERMGPDHPAMMQFVAKGHDLFACVDGALNLDVNRAVIDRLWNPFIAAWFDGKNDPNLQLLRFEPRNAQIWLNENSLFAGVRIMLGRDPKQDYKDKVAEVRL